ncbi:RagB/SusD family nutrient uptake outer membrane protein [Segatella bryantii]|uniref:RagB/SusD family nutrient uptake outer membrane protein n=1 Tax=Segatella bryantii TaxID=77095 RepID=UPI001EDA523F|nr:RagB/SusD family nutrient uptake outer membrane protein [Segatella bryantii]UKK73792.1 RagB/SusD family nutrient uptake outer membrane protein [Segatella bryantii]
MKLKYIFITGLVMANLTSCNDYLDVDTPSKYGDDYVFSTKTEIDRALNGVYAQLLNNNLYGEKYLKDLCLNSDVDFATSSDEAATSNGFRRFECTADASQLKNTWNAAYQGIEYANNFIYQLEKSNIYKAGDEDLFQKMGEAKVIRAMFYNDIIDLWGDVPFSFTPTSEKEDMITPIVNRDTIRTLLIQDLQAIAPRMKYARSLENTIEHVSKEACWAMISRMALSAGGYSLRPNKSDVTSHGTMERPANYREFYQIARNYADSVIKSNTHSLNKSYRNVFIDECNFIVDNGDDPIFEIPFAKKTSGNIGYIQGPKASLSSGVSIQPNVWGETSGSAQISAFYGYSFDEKDTRRDYLNGMWSYTNQGDSICVPAIQANYTMYNNKWSKLWSQAGNFENNSSGSTGINYPYLRYADVLLMFAEAENELNNGPTEAAKNALKQVRRRAFSSEDIPLKVDHYVDSVSANKESFLMGVLNERKWEFAGENMRWKDLVRNNLYSVECFYSFLRYYGVGENAGGTSQYLDYVAEHDGVETSRFDKLPFSVYYRRIANPKNTDVYPNTALEILEIANPYTNLNKRPTDDESITNEEYTWKEYQGNFGWWNDGKGTPTNQCMYSFYGFIRGSENGMIYLVGNDGNTQMLGEVTGHMTAAQLPVVRYILPYPSSAIQRSAGAYKNYYGYAN